MKHPQLAALVPLVMVTLAAAPAAASDCWMAPLYELSFARPLGGGMPAAPEPGGGVSEQIFEFAGGLNQGFNHPAGRTFDLDAALVLAHRFRFGGALGLCNPRVGSGLPLVLGISVATQLRGGAGSRFDLVAQAGASGHRADDFTVLTIPVLLGAGLELAPQVTIYAGPMAEYTRGSAVGFEYTTSETRLGAITGLQLPIRRPLGLNAAVAVLRGKTEGYRYCDGEVCYGEGSSTRWLSMASLRLTYSIGR